MSRIRIGGRARYFIPVKTGSQLKDVLVLSKEQRLPFYVIGNGSNVLFSDDEFVGTVIRLGGAFKRIFFDFAARQVTAGAGVPLRKLGCTIALQGFAGCSFMGVIPGTVGGAVRMNAGTARTEEIRHHALRVVALDPETLTVYELAGDDLAFGYRQSVFSRSRMIILEATFKLPETRESCPGEALQAVKQLLAHRRSHHPALRRTFGSTFKNPEGQEHGAGWHLEQVGMKGLSIGGAMVTREHANWIVNTGTAASSDVKELIEVGRKRVYEQFGIRLEREVIYLPEDMESWL